MSLVVHIIKIEYYFPRVWWELRHVKYKALSPGPGTEAWYVGAGCEVMTNNQWMVSRDGVNMWNGVFHRSVSCCGLWCWRWFSRKVMSDSCDLVDCSAPDSYVCGIFQPRILGWVAISFTRESSWHRDLTHISCAVDSACIAGRCFSVEPPRNCSVSTISSILKPPKFRIQKFTRNLPEKEFRIMIIKMIQNLENKMELQVNSLETRIKKMQEMFNKDLQEIKRVN